MEGYDIDPHRDPLLMVVFTVSSHPSAGMRGQRQTTNGGVERSVMIGWDDGRKQTWWGV